MSTNAGSVTVVAKAPGAVAAHGVVVCFDIGTKRTGVAATDADQLVATPRDPIVHAHDAELTTAITRLATEMNAVGVVCGLPLALSGEQSESSRRIRTLAKAVAAHGLTVSLIDERFSTVEADRALTEAGLSSRQKRDRLDSPSAALLLQSWLDHRRPAVERDKSSTQDRQRRG